MSATRTTGKSAAAFRTISEVSEQLEVPQHVLRFWETKFAQVRPLKRGGGRRYYRPEDIALLRRIRDLLYGHGSEAARRAELEALLGELIDLRDLLRSSGE
jgi:predicted amidophosphoribosyltransferase